MRPWEAMLHRPDTRYVSAFAIAALVLATGVVACTWVLDPSLLPMKGQSWIDIGYPFLAGIAASIFAYVAAIILGRHLRGVFLGPLVGASVAFLSYFATCVAAAAAISEPGGVTEILYVALGGYVLWSFLGLWGLGVPLLGAVIGWQRRGLWF